MRRLLKFLHTMGAIGMMGSMAALLVMMMAAPAPANAGPLLARLQASIDQAVHQAAFMPEAARRQHREGRAQVRFNYIDGAVAAVALAHSSQSRLLDDAALAAVRTGRYPAPPPPLRGRLLTLSVWIDFHLTAPATES